MEDLKEFIEQDISSRMKRLGMGEQMTLEEIQGTGPISGTITFLNGESFKKAAKYFQNKNKDLDNL